MSKTLFIINRVINPTSSSFEICDGWLCFIWKYALRLYDAIITDKFNWSCSSCMNLSLSSSNWYLWWFWASLMTESDSNHRFVGTLCAIIALFNLCNKRYVTYPTCWDPKPVVRKCQKVSDRKNVSVNPFLRFPHKSFWVSLVTSSRNYIFMLKNFLKNKNTHVIIIMVMSIYILTFLLYEKNADYYVLSTYWKINFGYVIWHILNDIERSYNNTL